ncbi:peptidoglycan DD-metalloendopeptidase family protein [Pontibacter sp. G13]|uniref:peptidoglycan DD-metalloendopeptidase family protein n=1 Tax=Pontibacter sp. G13 TaxID=3074898 RepID=UPI0028895987|nr:peptidoglycan DD-metalloendopeptidase family protein [Pontibacter sp. G13]WNJ17732.1 peptidoglycan DD-metalloendopeptidase family protein [Pontibacter sp. G13]
MEVAPTLMSGPSLKRMSAEQYGIDVSNLRVVQSQFKKDQFLTDLLSSFGVPPHRIESIERKAEGIFDVRDMRPGNPYTLILDKESGLKFFVYEVTPAEYAVVSLMDTVSVYAGRKEVKVQVLEAGGVIDNSLNESLAAQELSPFLGYQLEEVFSWTLDFRKLDVGDTYKFLYEMDLVEGFPMGIPRLLAAEIQHGGQLHHAFRYGQGDSAMFVNELCQPISEGFLFEPFEEGTAKLQESGGAKDRVRKGVVYETELGTPIVARAQGQLVSIKRGSTGYYVRIKHGSAYATQYMHLTQLNMGIEEGNWIQAGDTLGQSDKWLRMKYWRKGRPVDPLRKHPTYVAVPNDLDMADFKPQITVLQSKLENLRIPDVSVTFASKN